MKRLLLIFSLLTIAFEVVAQSSKNTLEIDPASFRPVQTDALSGVAIDPIGLDRSKRPCARVKMHVNRMTRDEIANLEIRLPGGNVVLMKKTVAVEGNGLIFELTAKEQTRFYLHHEKYGDSNEVTVNLEGNKEYRIDAQLNLLLPITVVSNVKGADVYVDNVFKGVTNDNYMFTVDDVVPGNHKITIKYGASSAEQTVDVNSGNVSFRVEVNTATSRPQYVVFNLEPKYATVFVEGKPLATGSTGVATTVLQNGIYSWRAIANGYHEQNGTFTVSGAKVVENVNLVIDAAMVTISAGDGVEIWVNNEKKGNSPWRGQLFSGTYIFEARKAGHRTTTLSQSITSSQPEQSYTLDTPTPIIGTINISSEPAMADVYIDGKSVGQTPMFTDVLVGEHTVELQLSGYSSQKQTVLVAEGQTASVSAMLTKVVAAAPAMSAPASVSSSSGAVSTAKTYKVGDYYNDGKKEGVVFWVDETGQHGKIVSLTQSSPLQWSSDKYEQKRLIDADDNGDGAKNMAVVKQIPDWQSKYPAFKWCADLGDGWYLPAIEELKIFTLDKTVHDAVNQTLETKGEKLANMGEYRLYLSSTEANLRSSGKFCAWFVYMFNGFTGNFSKRNCYSVRAVSAF